MKSKDKQIRDLKDFRDGLIICIIVVLSAFVIYSVFDTINFNDVKQQLSECQDNKTIISCVTNMRYQPCNQTSGYGYYDCSKFKEIENCEVLE